MAAIFYHILKIINRYSDGVIASMGGSRDFELDSFLTVFRGVDLPDLFRGHFASHGFKWIDKTPGSDMLRALPSLCEIYSQSRFILMKRHPIDTINSMMRKFADRTFQTHCINWSETYSAWLEVRHMYEDRVIEIEYADLVAIPEIITKKIGKMVNATEEQVKSMSDFLHDNGHIEQTDIRSGATRPCIDDVDWSPQEKRIFAQTCGRIADSLGYDVTTPFTVDVGPRSTSLFYPRVKSARARVVGENEYCYPVESGIQLCPNPAESEPVKLEYRDLPVRPSQSLKMAYRREFLFGSDVQLHITIRSSSSQQELASRSVSVLSSEMVDLMVDIGQYEGRLDIDITATTNSIYPDHSTIILLRPHLG